MSPRSPQLQLGDLDLPAVKKSYSKHASRMKSLSDFDYQHDKVLPYVCPVQERPFKEKFEFAMEFAQVATHCNSKLKS